MGETKIQAWVQSWVHKKQGLVRGALDPEFLGLGPKH
jgi:hypothetical protein